MIHTGRDNTLSPHESVPQQPTETPAILDGPAGPEFGPMVDAARKPAEPDYRALGFAGPEDCEGRN